MFVFLTLKHVSYVNSHFLVLQPLLLLRDRQVEKTGFQLYVSMEDICILLIAQIEWITSLIVIVLISLNEACCMES